MLWPKTYIVWDLETSGLDWKTCKILEIGAMKVRNGQVIDRKSWILDHGIHVPEEITRITTIDDALIKEVGVEPKVALAEFFSWLKEFNGVNITHNGFKFDIPFLNQAFFTEPSLGVTIGELEEFKNLLYKNGVDTAAMYKAIRLPLERMWNENFAQFAKRVLDTKIFGLKYNIAHCCKELGIDTTTATFHRALGDIELTHEIFKKLSV